MPKVLACPDMSQLSELLSGKVAVDDKDTLLGHLETCDVCANRIGSLTNDDSLVELFRQAKNQGEEPFKDKIRLLIDSLSKMYPLKKPSAGEDKTVLPAAETAPMAMFCCPKCGKNLKVKEQLAGKKVKCPLCQAVVDVPARDIAAERTIPPAAALPERTQASNSLDTTPPEGKIVDPELIGALSPPRAPDELGRLGNYRVLKVLGAGGMGVVYKAEDPQLKRLVALKAMLPNLGASANARKRFLREAQAAATVKHDHIVSIYQVGEERGVPFLAMEFLQGESLDDRLKREERLPLADVVRIGREMADGLEAAHDHGLIHRDIKPANIWLETRGRKNKDEGGRMKDETNPGAKGVVSSFILPPSSFRVKILDFGLARATDEQQHLTQSGAIVGTPAFMAPEQAQGSTVDQRCDLFSLGCVLYRMCTGQLPFIGTSTVSTLMAVAMTEPPPPHEINLDVPRSLSDLVMRLLAKDPQKRPATAREVADALEEIAAQIVVTPPTLAAALKPQAEVLRSLGVTETTSLHPAGPAPRRRRPMVIAAVLLALGGIIGGLLFFAPIRIGTDKGEFVINTDDENFLFHVSKDTAGKDIVFLHDKLKDRKYTLKAVPSATNKQEYDVEFTDQDSGLTFKSKTITIRRGQVVALKAEFVPRRGDAPVVANRFTNSLGMEFALVPKGKAWLGGGNGKEGTKEVNMSQDFYLGVYDVTQEEWQKVMGNNPSHFSREGPGKDAVKDFGDAELKRFPVENVSWDDAQLFLERLNRREKDGGWIYRLPRVDELEYACRGGPQLDKLNSAHDFYFDKPMKQLSLKEANFAPEPGKGLRRTCKVGSYKPNQLGLYDMHGNVYEWCDDSVKAGDGASHRLHSGGSWDCISARCRAEEHHANPPSARSFYLGLRLARVPSNKFTNSLGMEFALVPKGKSWLGGINGKEGMREVNMPQDFYLGAYEVTQEEWTKVTGKPSPSYFSRGGQGADSVKDIDDANLQRFPVENVSWDDSQAFIKLLNEKVKNDAKEAGWEYRLPTEEQWEYACRGGPMSDKAESAFDHYFEKPSKTMSKDQANFNGSDLKRTNQVGSYPPNRLGLYDMHGNVWEWCEDLFDKGRPDRVIRSGSWSRDTDNCRAAYRDRHAPSARHIDLGFRLARVPGAQTRSSSEILVVKRVPFARPHTVYHVAVSPDGKRFAHDQDGYGTHAMIFVWDAETGKECQRYAVPRWTPNFTPDGKRFLLVHDTLCVHDAATGALLNRIIYKDTKQKASLGGHYSLLPTGHHALMFTAQNNGKKLPGSSIHLVDLEAGKIVHSWHSEGANAWKGIPLHAQTHDGKLLILKRTGEKGAGAAPGLLVWDLENNKESEQLAALKQFDSIIAFLPGDEQAVAQIAGKEFLINVADGKNLGPLPQLPHPAELGKWVGRCPGDYRIVLAAYQDGRVLLYNAITANPRAAFRFPPGEIPRANIALSPDGCHACVATNKALYLLSLPRVLDATEKNPRFTNSLGMEFALVPKGKSWLGGEDGKEGTMEVNITQDFYMGVYEVTQEEWRKVMSKNPSHFARDGNGSDAVKDFSDDELRRFPVENMSWEDAREFVKRLNEKVKKDALEAGWEYRLPTQEQWEYACRGGPMADRADSAFNYYFETPRAKLAKNQANFKANGWLRPCQVGSYSPNRLGLFDMHGNVSEWCADPYDSQEPLAGVGRGGSWASLAGTCAAATRIKHTPTQRAKSVGLRLARVPTNKFTNSLGMDFALVPKGKSWLGGSNGKEGTMEVNIAQDFYLGVHEVTQEDWQKVMGKNPSYHTRFIVGKGITQDEIKRFPVDSVTWVEAQAFVKLVNEKVRQDAKEAGWEYRLPTEEQWEYACRGGPMSAKADSAFYFYFEKPYTTMSKEQGNLAPSGSGSGLNRPCKVGSYPPNRLGLYDMHGNVFEWCEDLFDGTSRVIRGGGWGSSTDCRAATRKGFPLSQQSRTQGLRLARVPVGKDLGVQTDPDKKSAAKQTLEGTWKVVSHNGFGAELTRIIITADKLTFEFAKEGKIDANYKLGPSAQPKTFDIESNNKFLPGIYLLAADELTLCWDAKGKARPMDFTKAGKAGGDPRFVVLQRLAGNNFKNSLGMDFALVPKGKSWLGGGQGTGKVGTKEVNIAEDFYLGVYEVTQEEWQKVTGKPSPSHFSRDGKGADAVKGISMEELKRFPVENVSWHDAKEFVKLLNDKVKKDGTEAGWEYRLPTEEQWEYACRGGPMLGKAESAFDYYFDKPAQNWSKEQANIAESGLKRTCKVGSYRPNRLGLYDMHGNVREWCEDKFEFDPADRMSRGGSCLDPGLCGAGHRDRYPPVFRTDRLGLRLARVPVARKAVDLDKK